MTEDTAATTLTAVPGQRDPRRGTGRRDHVTVRMPAEGAYLSVLRTATAGLAARLDFTLDEIEDLRIAVDEACAMLLAQAVPGTNLECDFDLGRGQDDDRRLGDSRPSRGRPPATPSPGPCCPRWPGRSTPGSGADDQVSRSCSASGRENVEARVTGDTELGITGASGRG